MCKNVWKKCVFPNRTFLNFKKNNRTIALLKRPNVQKGQTSKSHFYALQKVIAHFKNGWMPNTACLAICTFGIYTLFAHFWTFPLFKSAIALFVALCKSAIVRSHFLVALFKSVIVWLHIFVALFKSALVQLHLFVALFKMQLWSRMFLSIFSKLWLCDRTFLHFSKVPQKMRLKNWKE